MMSLKTTLFTELLREVGHGTIEVVGSSMLPAIRPGDVLRVEAGPVKVGDVVVFNQAGHLCAHRLLAVIDSQAITRGDANRRLDAPFALNEILGRVTSLERDGRTIRDIKSHRMMSLFIRNSSFIHRLYLRIHSAHRRLLASGSAESSPGISNLQS